MQPQRLEGFNYAPLSGQSYDPWADVRLAQEIEKRQREKANQPKSKRGSKNQSWLSSIISELGGAGGAAGGAALGTALLPGIGTVLGAGIGGFLGGTGGRLAENKIRDDEYRLGDALKEGAWSGALSGAGSAFQVAKAAKGAKALSGALGDDVAKGAIKAVPRTGVLQNKGLAMTSKAGGYFTGAQVPGAKPLTTSQVQQYDKLLRKLKIPANDASDLARGVEGRLKQVGGVLEKSLAKGNRPIPTKEVKAFADDLAKKVASNAGLGKAEAKIAQEQAAKLSKIKDVKGLLDFRKELDRTISYVANPDSPEISRQAVARIFRGGIKDKVNTLVPGLKRQNNLYHDLSDIQSYVLKAANRGGTQTTSGSSLFGTLSSSATANTAKAKAGAALSKVGAYTAGTGGPLTQVTNQAMRQAPAGLGRAISPSMDPTQGLPPEELGGEDQALMDAYEQISGGGMDPMEGMAGVQQPQQPAYTLQQALAEAQQLLGPEESPASYLSYAKALMDASEGPESSANQKNASAKAQGASRIIDELEAVFTQSGGARGPIQGRLQQAGAAAGGGNQALKSYQDLRAAYTAQISRALGEVGVLTDKDREVIQRAIPSVNDSQEAAAIKLQTLRNILGQLANSSPQQPSYGDYETDLSSLIQQGAF